MDIEPHDSGVRDWIEYATTEPDMPSRRLHVLTWVAIGIGVIVMVGLVMLRPTGDFAEEARSQLAVLGVPSDLFAASVVSAVPGPCPQVPESECVNVGFAIADGPDTGEVFEQAFVPGGTTPEFSVGQDVVLSYRPPEGTVASAIVQPCSAAPDTNCVLLAVLLDSGTAAGSVATYEATIADPAALLLVGEEAVATYFVDDDGTAEIVSLGPTDVQVQYQFADYQRRPILLIVAVVFALVVIGLGGWRGLAALGGLVASVAVILLFVLPSILDGQSPVLVAVVGAALVAYLALYLAHGFRLMTTVALLGTLAALILTAMLSSVVVTLANLTGFASEEATLLTLFDGLDIRGLLLAGVVLGAAGAIDDVTVTQASAVAEIKAANPELGFTRLFAAGLRIGRDHIASTVNTLLLAYAGAALPLLVLFILSEQSLGAIANSEVVAVEIVRTLVGSIGLVAAVPITTWLAVKFADDLEVLH
jgi:uncharacterized membrane protein